MPLPLQKLGFFADLLSDGEFQRCLSRTGAVGVYVSGARWRPALLSRTPRRVISPPARRRPPPRRRHTPASAPAHPRRRPRGWMLSTTKPVRRICICTPAPRTCICTHLHQGKELTGVKRLLRSTSKTGRHGHAKCHLVAIGIFNGKKLEDIVPSSQL